MKLKDLSHERVCLVGLGSENFSLLAYLASKRSALPVTVIELRGRRQLEKTYPLLKKWKHVQWVIGEPRWKVLAPFSVIIKSSGAFFSPALRKKIRQKRIVLTSAIQLFLDNCPSRRLIGVTGTKGKGTTSSLIYAILRQAKKRVWLGANISIPLFSFFNKVRKGDWIILELSSFQLEDMHSSPHIAVLTNFSPEHLRPADPNNPNYHPSLRNYWEAKYNLLRFQGRDDIAVINQKLRPRLKKSPPARALYFTTSDLPNLLIGEHNRENIAAAETVARHIGLPARTIQRAVARFKGLPYRLEKISGRDSLSYYNDSFATTPEAAITALNSFNQPVILLAGGADKGSDFSRLAKIAAKKTKAVILFKGTATPRLERALRSAHYPKNNIRIASSMKQALRQARAFAASGDAILLSPGCASFGLFKNYKDRGEQFRKEVG